MERKVFLRLDGIDGESKHPRHMGEIEVHSISWGGKHLNSINGVGRWVAYVHDLTITKDTDKTSPILMNAVTNGRDFGEVIVTVENLSKTGSLMRSTTLRLYSTVISEVTAKNLLETVNLNYAGSRFESE